ncbi:tRNA pseudouridine(38-40) synthase TruA [Mesonia sp. MT50]|uniref:tRNA pseudouridine synthase A n=1 Tax=Mesonia profundi TaxID=3070998 RepID=A0ABU1A1Y8_9FLAO|nr:tRNA pseudouridine(38-40) synthase TruA [Mesonia profundi]MDQ7917719.1 tRNA pseudouridine(38-40) synthase TruA [Mesonia profundi]
MRYFIDLSFNGKDFFGWQRQPDVISVQEVVEDKLSVALQENIEVVGAGRTDAGVHAQQIFAHFDTQKISDITAFIFKLNTMLPPDIAVNDVFEVPPDAHARFDATAREYTYYVDTQKNPFTHETACYIKKTIDVKAMNEAAKILLDYKDFQCFSKVKTDVFTYNCTIMYAHWEQKEHQLVFTIKADRFLRNMVRAIVGTLLEIGVGKRTLNELHQVIESKDRSAAGKSVAAKGLFLTQVEYPKRIEVNHGE